MRRAAGLFALLAAAACASAQVTLSTVQGGVTTAAGAVVSFGSVAAGWDVSDIVFNVSYTGTTSPYYLTFFNLQLGTPFSVVASDWPSGSLPVAIPSGGLNFTVRFQPNAVAESFNATLKVGDASNPITVLLSGQGVAGFTVVAANQPLSAGSTINFGSVQVGSSLTVAMTLANQTSQPLTVGAIAIQGVAFQPTGVSPAGASVPSGSSAEVQLVFSPTTAGPQQGTLTIGVAGFPLTGMGVAPPPPAFPAPSIELTLATPASAQQGSLSIGLASPTAASGQGNVTLAFQSAVSSVDGDPTVTFADGTLSASFTVTEGASTGQFAAGPSISFGTGTTAGTLVFTVTLGSNSAQTNVTIAPAAIGIDAAVGARNVACDPALLYCTGTNIQLQINGWDNTRSASQIVFKFMNASGASIAPPTIAVPAGTAFQQYFAGSDMAGVFGLSAFFPVTGDADLVVAAVVQLVNSVGTVETDQITF